MFLIPSLSNILEMVNSVLQNYHQPPATIEAPILTTKFFPTFRSRDVESQQPEVKDKMWHNTGKSTAGPKSSPRVTTILGSGNTNEQALLPFYPADKVSSYHRYPQLDFQNPTAAATSTGGDSATRVSRYYPYEAAAALAYEGYERIGVAVEKTVTHKYMQKNSGPFIEAAKDAVVARTKVAYAQRCKKDFKSWLEDNGLVDVPSQWAPPPILGNEYPAITSNFTPSGSTTTLSSGEWPINSATNVSQSIEPNSGAKQDLGKALLEYLQRPKHRVNAEGIICPKPKRNIRALASDIEGMIPQYDFSTLKCEKIVGSVGNRSLPRRTTENTQEVDIRAGLMRNLVAVATEFETSRATSRMCNVLL